MTIKEQLTQDMKTALRAHDSQRLTTIRFLLSEIKNAQIDGAADDDTSLQKIIATQVKKTKDALNDFTTAGRTDLVVAEEAKIKVMTSYLPKQLTNSELTQIIQEILAQADPAANSGQLIGQIMKKTAGRADGAQVQTLLTKLRSGSSGA
jgi:uncharacterized protein YqeY